MKRGEFGAVLAAAAIAGAIGLVLALFAANLVRDDYFNVGSTLLQYTSGPATIGAVAMAGWLRWHRTCAVPYCLRFGEHPVDGTLKKVCVHHHTLEHHELVHDLHAEAHRLRGRLGLGESHRRGILPEEPKPARPRRKL